MNRRLTSTLLLALVISAVLTLWLNSRFSKNRGQVAAAPVKSLYVAASGNLQANQVLHASDLRMISWPSAEPLAGAYTSPEAVIGRVLLFPLSEGEPILDRQLSKPGAGSGIIVKIPDGMRAISLRTDDVVGVAGFLLPDTHVDVLVTLHTSNSTPINGYGVAGRGGAAAGQKTEPDPEGKASSATVVTILVKPEDAERVVLASNQGTIHFALRNGLDREAYKGPPALLGELPGVPPAIPVKEEAKAAEPAAAKPYTVETILGKTQRTDDFR